MSMSQDGWSHFLEGLKKRFCLLHLHVLPLLLLMNSYAAHEFIRLAREHGVTLLFLPPHVTQTCTLQLLDYRPLKNQTGQNSEGQ